MKIGQAIGRTARGRPQLTSESELLDLEASWVWTFVGLRDGVSESETDAPATGILVKSTGREREKIRGGLVGRKLVNLSAHKELADGEDWRNHVQREETNFMEAITGQTITKMQCPARPPERKLWEALERVRTPGRVRRICSQSKTWLKWRWKLPNGGYFELPGSCPRSLHEHAEGFCKAKSDTRYPKNDNRTSGDYRRIQFLARAMAGLSLSKPIAPSTSVDFLRKMKHDNKCACWRCSLRIAPRYKTTLPQYLSRRRIPLD